MKIFKIDLGYKQLSFGYNAKMEGYTNFVYTEVRRKQEEIKCQEKREKS